MPRARESRGSRVSDLDGREHRLGVWRETERGVAGLEAGLDGERVGAGPGIRGGAHHERERGLLVVGLDGDAEVRVEALVRGRPLDGADQLERLPRCEGDARGDWTARSLADRVNVPALVDPRPEGDGG